MHVKTKHLAGSIASLAIAAGMIGAAAASADQPTWTITPGPAPAPAPQAAPWFRIDGATFPMYAKVGETATRQFVVTNASGGTARFMAKMTGPHRGLDVDPNCPSSGVPSGGTCTVTVTYSPVAAQFSDGRLTVTGRTESGHGSLDQSVDVHGTPLVWPDPQPLAFGDVTVGTAAVQTIHVQALAPTNVTRVSLWTDDPTPFQIVDQNCVGTQVSQCDVTVRFSPTTTGPAQVTLAVQSTIQHGTTSFGDFYKVPLSGNGVADEPVLYY